MALPAQAAAILDFWFGTQSDAIAEHGRTLWFVKDAATDAIIHARFLPSYELAVARQLDAWRGMAKSSLALVILLDQFPRNMFRGQPRAFASDGLAREVASESIERGFDLALAPVQRAFMYLPFEHSETLADQRRSLDLFATLAQHEGLQEMVRYAQLHYDVIERFGRFPHRNDILGRRSTAAESAFLAQPGSSF